MLAVGSSSVPRSEGWTGGRITAAPPRVLDAAALAMTMGRGQRGISPVIMSISMIGTGGSVPFPVQVQEVAHRDSGVEDFEGRSRRRRDFRQTLVLLN